MNKIASLISLILLPAFMAQGQISDLAKVEFTYFPQEESDNSLRRFKAGLTFPIKMGNDDSYLLPSLEYENIHFKYKDETPFVKGEDLDRYQSFSLNLGYTYKMNEDWRLGIQGGVMMASNFEEGTILKDDLLYTGLIVFIKDKNIEEVEKPWRLILGLHYSTTSGRPFPLPVINYFKQYTPRWSYTLGVPKSNWKFEINNKNALQAFVTLDGFYANIQNNRDFLNSDKIAENISMTIVLGGIGYEYSFTKHLVYYLYAGHTIMNDIRLRDGNKDDVMDVNKENTFYGRSGIKIKI